MPAITDHQCFNQPDDVSVKLWRYMDLSKFAALLQKSAITFSRADNLGDPFEGSISPLDISASEQMISTILEPSVVAAREARSF